MPGSNWLNCEKCLASCFYKKMCQEHKYEVFSLVKWFGSIRKRQRKPVHQISDFFFFFKEWFMFVFQKMSELSVRDNKLKMTVTL